MSKKENIESKKRFIYVNLTFRSDKHVAFYLCPLLTF